MVSIKTFISTIKPTVHDCLWLKPTADSFEAILIEAGQEKPLKFANNKSGFKDEAKSIIGSVQDEKTANTINGAKAYAKNVKKEITGNPGDASSELTLYGLKSLIEEKTSKKDYGNKSK